MNRLLRFQWPIFLLVCLLIAALLSPRAWAIRHLYVSSGVRMAVQRELERISATEGWLLSDLTVTRVDHQFFRFLHRPHYREGSDAECFVSSYTGSIELCTD